MKIKTSQAVDILSEYVAAEAAKRAPLAPDEVTPRMFALRVSEGGCKMGSDAARDLLAQWTKEGKWTVRVGIVGGKEGLIYRPKKRDSK